MFFTGRQHAGENLEAVLRQRSADLSPPLQRCEGLARNEPQEGQTLLGGCLAHGRRGLVEVAPHFPEECRHVVESVRSVDQWDAQAQAQGLPPEARLHFPQAHSPPVMEALKTWRECAARPVAALELPGNAGARPPRDRPRWNGAAQLPFHVEESLHGPALPRPQQF